METEKKKNPEKEIIRASVSEEKEKKIKILLAEDEEINQMVVESILERLGYSVDIFENGKDAVKALEQASYDLVLMDCEMPVMNGYEATKEIRSPASKVLRHNIPVIALTGNAMDGDKNKYLNAGMNDYIFKPVNPVEFSATIEKWLFKHEPLPEKQTSDRCTEDDGILDLSILAENLADDKKMIRKILNDFYEYIPDKITILKKAYDMGDALSVRRMAHTIKGASANVGAVALQDTAHQIETAGESLDLTGVDSLIMRFDEQIAEFKKAIGRIVI